jgi:hypothetical protein
MVAPGNKPPARPIRRLDPEQRRALQMLAISAPSGLTGDIMLAHGFSIEMLDGMAEAGFVVVVTGTVRASAGMISVPRLRITETGRKAIEDA